VFRVAFYGSHFDVTNDNGPQFGPPTVSGDHDVHSFRETSKSVAGEAGAPCGTPTWRRGRSPTAHGGAPDRGDKAVGATGATVVSGTDRRGPG
jgi:hypothetical protein